MNQSESEYDGIAEAYRDSKQLSFRKYVAQLDMAESVDVVMAMYLLNYAGTKEELLNFVHVAYNRLRPGAIYRIQ